MSFYIYAPSNVKGDFDKTNSAASFIIQLNPPLELKTNKYRVAITEISHPSVDISEYKSKVSGGGEGEKTVHKNKQIPALMFIYSNVVKPLIVGDSRTPLLRAISTPFKSNSKNTNTSTVFNPPYYQPIASNYIDKIEVSINTHSGDIFPFRSGTTLITLHFIEENE